MRKILKRSFVLSLVLVMVLVTNITHAATTTFNSPLTLIGEQDEFGTFTAGITFSYNVENQAGIKTVDIIIDDEVCGTDNYIPGGEQNPSDQYFKIIGGNYEIPVSYLKTIKNDTLTHTAKVKVTDANNDTAVSEEVEFVSDPSDEIKASTIDTEFTGTKTSDGIYTDQIKLNITGKNESAGILGLSYYVDGKEDEAEYIDYSPGTEKNPGEDLLKTISEEFDLDMKYLAKNEPSDYNHTITISITNGNKEVTEKIVDFKVNVTKPEINMTAEDGQSYTKDFTVEITAKDKNAENLTFDMEVSKDGNVVKSVKSVKSTGASYATEGDGSYTIKAKATDEAGNTVEKNVSFEIDSTKPGMDHILFEGPKAEGYDWFNDSVIISTTAYDKDELKKITLKINGTEMVTEELSTKEYEFGYIVDSEWILNNPTGIYEVEITVEDEAGNTKTNTGTFYTAIAEPVVSIDGIYDNGLYGPGAKAEITNDTLYPDEVTTTVTVEKDGEEVAKKIDTGTVIFDNFKAEGEYTLTAVAVDPAGNVSEEESITFKIDLFPPEISDFSIDGPLKEGFTWFADSVTVSASAKDANLDTLSMKIAGIDVIANSEDSTVSTTLDKEWFLNQEDEDGKYEVVITAEDKVGNVETKTKYIYGDFEAPTLTIEGLIDGCVRDVGNVSIESKDISTVTHYIEVNDGTTTYTYIKEGNTVSFSNLHDFEYDKPYTVKAYSTDMAGNVSNTETVEFVFDVKGPNITGPSFEGNKVEGTDFYFKTVEISFAAEDELAGLETLEVRVNDKTVYKKTDGTPSGRVTLEDEWFLQNIDVDGKYLVEVIAKDFVGNEAVKSDTIYVSSSKPVVTITGIEDIITSKKQTLKVESADALEKNLVTSITINKDGELYRDIVSHDPVTTFSDFNDDGLYEISVFAENSKGIDSEVQTARYTKDSTKPELSGITLDGKNNEGWYNDEVKITATAKDATSKIVSLNIKVNDIEIKQEAIDSESINIEETITKEWISKHKSNTGKYTVKITVKDQAGNTATTTKNFNADVSAPTVSLSGIINGAFLKNTPMLTVKTEDDLISNVTTKVTITKDGKAYDEISKKQSTLRYDSFNDDGVYTIKVQAVDLGGNLSEEKTLSFTKDTTAPDVSSINLSGNRKEGYAWYDGEVGATASASDSLSKIKGYKITINGQTLDSKSFEGSDKEDIACKVKTTWINEFMTIDGRYDIYFTVVDRAGNSTTVYDTFYVDLDTPIIALSGFDNNAFLNETPKFKVTIEDDYSTKCTSYITIKKDGKEFLNDKYTGSKYEYEGFDKDGRYDISVYTCDMAGNKSKTKTLSFTKDTVAPIVSLSGAKEGECTNKDRKITVNVTEKNYSNMQVAVKGSKSIRADRKDVAFGTVKPNKEEYSYSKTFSASGTYKFQVSARDAAGNVAKTDSLSFTIDKVKPKVKIADIPKQNNYNSKVAPKITWEDDNLGTKKVTLTRASGNSADGLTFKDQETTYTGTRTYTDFIKKRIYDDIYTLTCTVTDKAGNTNSDAVTFTVNRFGSKFELSPESKKINKKYVKEVKKDIVIYETNVSGLKTQETFIYKDGERIEGTVTAKEAMKDGWYKYTYTFNKTSFEEEGVYTINIISLDKAGNTSEYMKEGKTPFKFCVDKTPPMISITGVKDRRNYKDGATAVVEVTDAINVKSCKAVVKDGDKVVFEKELTEKGGEVKIPDGKDLNLLVYATDEAGNRGKATVTEITTGISASSSFAKVALLLLSAIALISIIAFIANKKRKDNEREV